jgi:hypothetical protein
MHGMQKVRGPNPLSSTYVVLEAGSVVGSRNGSQSLS